MRVSDRFSKRFVGSQDTVETREVAIFVFNEVLGVNSIVFSWEDLTVDGDIWTRRDIWSFYPTLRLSYIYFN